MTMMCPNCGYCPHCGRSASPYYYGRIPTPTLPGPTWTIPNGLFHLQPGMMITGGHFVPSNTTNDLGPNITFTNTQGTNTQ